MEGPNPIQAETFEKLRIFVEPMAVLFWDEYRGDRIGLVWRPKMFLSNTFTVLQSRFKLAFSTVSNMNNKEFTMIPNTAEIINQLIEISNGIITDFDIL